MNAHENNLSANTISTLYKIPMATDPGHTTSISQMETKDFWFLFLIDLYDFIFLHRRDTSFKIKTG